MAQLKLLEYAYLIDASGSFSSLYEFEKFFGEFLDSRGLIGEIISPMNGSKDRRVMLVTKKPMIAGAADPNPVGRPQTLKGKFKELSDRKLRKPAIEFMKGKK
jgi:hypothetical protein